MRSLKSCVKCGSLAYPKIENYQSKKGTVENVFTWVCANVYCRMTWLPIEEEKRIDELKSKDKKKP